MAKYKFIKIIPANGLVPEYQGFGLANVDPQLADIMMVYGTMHNKRINLRQSALVEAINEVADELGIMILPFKKLTDITLAAATFVANATLTPTPTMVPADATYLTIAWAKVATGTTAAGATVNATTGEMTATGAGVIKLQATVADATRPDVDFVKVFDITVTAE